MLEVRCIDRVMLTVRQPRLQYGQGIHNFFCQHRGNRFVSSALMLPMTERFTAGIRHYIDTRRLDLVRFAKGQSKDQVAKEYLAGHHGGECILFVGVAQEKTRVWRTAQRQDRVTGKRYPWLYQEQAMVNHWYFYGFDADFGPYADRPVMPHRVPLCWSQRLPGVQCGICSRGRVRVTGRRGRPGGCRAACIVLQGRFRVPAVRAPVP